jgi:hypothetical protein
MYRVEAADVKQKGKNVLGATKRTAVHTGGGAALVAIIGAIKVPAESVLTFRLDAPLHVVEAH